MNKKDYLFEIDSIIDILSNCIEDTHEKYLNKLPKYKAIIDKSPNKFLGFHLKYCVEKEQFELAQYIKEVAKERMFTIE